MLMLVLDYDVYDAFQHMALNVKKGIIAWGDDEYLRKLDVDIPVYYYGFKETDDIYAAQKLYWSVKYY